MVRLFYQAGIIVLNFNFTDTDKIRYSAYDLVLFYLISSARTILFS